MFHSTRPLFAVAAIGAATVIAVSGGAAYALSAASGVNLPAGTVHGCITGSSHTLEHVSSVTHGISCPAGSTLVYWSVTGPKGPQGSPGSQGAPGLQGIQGVQGKQGPSGVVAVDTETGNATLPHIGGSWTAGHAVVKDIALKAGTYLVTLTGDFYKTATTPATPVLQIQLNGANHQLTGYTGAFPYNAAEATGTGTDGTPNGLEQTAVAAGIITMAADGTVEIDAFGYNPDRSGNGGGDFAVNATISITALQTP